MTIVNKLHDGMAYSFHFRAVTSLKFILSLFTNNTHFYLDIKFFYHKCGIALYTACADQIIEFSIDVKP